jgi:predicted transcriptional regulator
MKTNLTVKVDTDLVREAKVLAARRGTSVSRLVTKQLEELVRRDKAYQSAMQRALSRLQTGYDLQWHKPSVRDELYER